MSETYDNENHWYGWNGGECPVHPETRVEALVCEANGNILWQMAAKDLVWSNTVGIDPIIAFRITRLYVEPKVPREWWVNVYEQPGMMTGLYNTEVEANRNAAGKLHTCVLVREVLEPTQ